MSDWPSSLVLPQLTVVSSGSIVSGTGQQMLANTSTPFGNATIAFPAANRAIFIPVYLEQALTPQVAAWENGASVTGNIDVGIYDYVGTLLGHTGSTVQAGTSATQSAACTTAPATLEPGTYFLAFAASSASALVRSTGLSLQWLRVCGVQQMASALPLPSTATFAAVGSSYCPLVTIAGVATL